MGRIIDSCIECNGEIRAIGYERGTAVLYCGGCENYVHPNQVVKRYV